jgi:hypothetical protein
MDHTSGYLFVFSFFIKKNHILDYEFCFQMWFFVDFVAFFLYLDNLSID